MQVDLNVSFGLYLPQTRILSTSSCSVKATLKPKQDNKTLQKPENQQQQDITVIRCPCPRAV